MADVICPNCHSVTPPYRYCMACNSFLGDLLDQSFRNRSAGDRRSSLGLLARVWRALKRFVIPGGSGRAVGAQMDAHLRRVCRRLQTHGMRKLATSSTAEDEVALIAKVTDMEKFKQHIASVTTAVKCPADERTLIVTARMPANEAAIERLRQQPFVQSLKAARQIRPFLESPWQDAFAHAGSLPTDDDSHGGSGVVIGIIDFGLDFAHRNFRTEDGRTRILALWDQKAAPDAGGRCPKPFGYGRLFTEGEINEALQDADPYKALGYEVAKGGLFDASVHGTYVADVAAGNGLGSSCSGIAPQADIVFVDVATAGTPTRSREAVGATFGDSVQLLEAIRFIFDFAKARRQPCVINISLGTNGGPHDGTTPLEEAMDWLVNEEPNRAVVIAAGNSFGKSLHAVGRVPDRGSVDLQWRIPSFDSTSNEVEIWYAGEDRFTLDLLDPDGKRVARVKPGTIWESDPGSRGLMTVVNRLGDPNNGDNTINVFFDRGVRDGVWTLRLRGGPARNGLFHAWVERDESGQSRFVKATDKSYVISNECTLSSIACGHESIVVTSYDAHEPDLALSDFSSAGPTRDQREQWRQPTLSAPGDNVLAAQARTLVLRQRQSGTSMAAAVVTGTVALMLAEAHEQRMTLSADQIREILIRAAHHNPPSGDEWDPGYGYGRVCARIAAAEIRHYIKGTPHHATVVRSSAQ